MDGFRLDDSKWPIVLMTPPAYVMAQVEFGRYLDRLSRLCERGAPCGIVFDVRNAPVMPADQRRLTAERIERDVKRYGWKCPCAIVVVSPLHVGVAKVITWLLRDPHPLAAFSSIEAAERWALCELASERARVAKVG
jgi:hypothetical protein